MKGVSAIIATILMLMITIALTGTAYLYISGFFGSRTSVVLSFDQASNCNANNFTVYVRNDGTGVAHNINIDLTFPNGKKLTSVCSIPIITAGGSNSTACPRIGRSAIAGTYSVRAYGNGATASGYVYCSSDSSNPGLIGYWKFDDNGGNTAADSSGNGNTGTLVNSPTWVTGEYGNALNFNGANQYVTVNSNNVLSPEVSPEQMTLCAWIKLNSYPASSQSRAPVIEKGSSSMWEYALYVYQSGAGGISVWTSSGNDVAEPQGGNIPLNTWTFLCGSYSSSSAVVYINGASVASAVPSGTATANTAPVLIGARTDGSQYLNAIIDDVGIYNRALSQSEITELYNS